MKIKYYVKNYIKLISRSDLSIKIISFVLSIIIKLLYYTLKIKKINFEILNQYSYTGYIVLFWHGRFILPPFLVKQSRKKMFGLFSKHPDGKLIAKICSFNNINPIWGSTHYATPSTIRKSINILKNGHILGFTPDGPVGPRFNIATNSPMYFAMKARVPIVPLYISSENAIIANSWDRCMIVRPFSKVYAKVGNPIFITEEDFKNKQDIIKKNLQDIMIKEQQDLDKALNLPLIEPEIFEDSRAYHKMKRIGKI